MLGWNNSGNNQFMFSGRGSYTQNPPSIWAVAKLQEMEIAEKLDHVPLPEGPAGRFRLADYNNLGIWKFSKNIDLSKDLLNFLMQEEQFFKQIEASWGYSQPPLKAFEETEYYSEQPKLKYYGRPLGTVRAPGYPAPVTSPTQIAYNLRVVPIMFAKAVREEETVDGAVEWAETQLNRIYG